MADCSELAQSINDAIMNISSRADVKTLDDAVARYKKLVPGMTRQMVVDSIVEATEGRTGDPDALANRINAIKREARTDKALQEKIEELEAFIEAGAIPATKTRKQKTPPEAIQALRDVRDGLKKQLTETNAAIKQRAKQREPGQVKKLNAQVKELEKILKTGKVLPEAKKRGITATNVVQRLREKRDQLKKAIGQSGPARKARIEDQIKDLNRRLKTGDIFPKAKPEVPPQSKELERLEFDRDELQREIRRKISSLKPKTKIDKIVNFSNVFKSIRASLDLSAVRRQGGFFFLSRPFRQGKTLSDMFKATKSEIGLRRVEKEIENNPLRPLAAKAKLFIAPTDGTHTLSQMEDEFQSTIAERIPGVRMSERAYVSFLNSQRMDMFSLLVSNLGKNGEVTLQEATEIANLINLGTGRGSLGNFEKAAVGFNALFFSLRNAVSRVQIATGTPFFQAKSPRVKKLIAKEYGRFLIGLGVYYGLMMIALDMFGSLLGKKLDMSLEGNPLSSDFGKIKIGNSRIDPLSGISQSLVLFSRVGTGRFKSSTTGKISKITGKERKFGSRKPSEFIQSFIRNKLAPLPSTILNVLDKEDFVGEEFGLKDVPAELLIPLSFSEVKESIQEQGIPLGTTLGIMAIFGEGIQTYGFEVKMRKQSTAEIKEQLEKSVYKRTTKSKNKETGEITIRVQGQPHKGKEFKVQALQKELEKRQQKQLIESLTK